MTQAAHAAPDLAPPPTLEVRGGRKNFGAVHALRGVDLVARAGEVTALVGDNGAGKSTMIKCVAGIYPFDAGEVLFEGEPTHISVAGATPTRSASRSCTRTSRCATTSTSSTTCSSAGS